MGIRPKIKLKRLPSDTWLPQALQMLDLDAADLKGRTVVDSCHQILDRCKRLRSKSLRQLYQLVKRSARGSRNKTFMVKHICYTISMGLNHFSEGMVRNYNEFCRIRPGEYLDVYGYGNGYSGGPLRKKKEVPRGKKKLSKKPTRTSLRAGRETITALIVEALRRKGGSTDREIVGHVLKIYPERSLTVPKTVKVQLSYHLPKRFGNAFKRKGERFLISE